jgi:hypothetical protein
MSGLWDDSELSAEDLGLFSQEISAAALDLAPELRPAFLDLACEGSDRMRRQVELLLAEVWEEPPAPLFRGRYRPGDTVRACLILRPIGRGGMGEVYKAIQRPLRRIVAVKVLTSGPAAALAREAIQTARLIHSNIARVYDADLETLHPCIILEYVDGISLRDWLERHWRSVGGPPAGKLVRSIVRQVALALEEAHRHGLIHRDVKPENILLTKRGEDFAVKVVDFGVARQVDTPGGTIVGTAGYVAPEQLRGMPADLRSDIFGLGVVLYELLTGKHPFIGRTDAETYFNTLSTDPNSHMEGSGAELLASARRALQKSPDDRYQTTQSLIADLDVPGNALQIGPNPFLSDLPQAVQRWWERRTSGFIVALVSFLWGGLTLIMSLASGAACVRVLWAAPGVARVHEMKYGYAIEPNAGLWYLVGASLCFLTGFGFVEAAHRGLARTKTLSVARSAAGASNALERIARLNRQYFKYVTPVVILVSVCFVAIPELMFRGDHAFGWAQADIAGDQVSKSYEDLRRDGKIGELSPVTALCEGCSIRVAAVANDASGFQPPPPLWFAIFLAGALTHQIVLVSFIWWIIAKVLFFFGLLSTALVGHAKHALRLEPDFHDTDDYRFGLGRLDNVYYAILVLILLGSLGLFLQLAANVSKGTYLLTGDPAPALFGQVVLLLGTLGLLVVLVLTPVCVFMFLTIKAVDEELMQLSDARKSLESRLAETQSVDEVQRLRVELALIRERRETAGRQRLLPIKQPAFLVLLGTSLMVLVLLPPSVAWFRHPPSPAAIDRPSISDAVCAASGNPPLRTR